MNANEFRQELVLFMPGYRWTVHRSTSPRVMRATGVKVSGFNRLSTLEVERRENYAGSGFPCYTVRSAGFGRKAPFLGENGDITLLRALRGLQEHYQKTAATYRAHAHALETGRSSSPEASSNG